MTQKEAIEKLACYLSKYHTPDEWQSFIREATATFLRMVNERACAIEAAGDPRDDEWINAYSIRATITLIEQLKE